ncbi:MAG: hypothetical protein EBR47_09715 [Betaproteobacteria bacterium]|jgi:hypothetical protein|nr:hypothetical protein [Betaproteobacteria bacterium]
MKKILCYFAFVLAVVSAYAQSGNAVQKPESWNLTVVEVLMYPGSSVQYNQTVIATYDSQSQCESARKYILTKFNSSTQCNLKKKTKVNI